MKNKRNEWTVMVYLGGDNNLAEEMVYALKCMQLIAGKHRRFEVFALYDGGVGPVTLRIRNRPRFPPEDVLRVENFLDTAETHREKEAKDLQKQRFGQNGDLFKKRQELVKPIQEKVYNAIKKIAENGSFAIIFDKSGEGLTMLYTSSKYDKSDDVLNELGYKTNAKGLMKDLKENIKINK